MIFRRRNSEHLSEETQMVHAQDVDPIFPPVYNLEGVLCKPAILDPKTGDFRRFVLDFDDQTETGDMLVLCGESTEKTVNYRYMGMLLAKQLIGGEISESSQPGLLEWRAGSLTVGELSRKIATANEVVEDEHKILVPFPQHFNGYTVDAKARSANISMCSAIFSAVSMGYGLNPETGKEHPIRPFQTSEKSLLLHDLQHYLETSEILLTDTNSQLFRDLYRTLPVMDTPQIEYKNESLIRPRQPQPLIASLALQIDRRSYESTEKGSEEEGRNIENATETLTAHGVSLSDIPIVS